MSLTINLLRKYYEVSVKFHCKSSYPEHHFNLQEYEISEIMFQVKEFADKNSIPYDFLIDKAVIFVEGINPGGTYDNPIILEPDFSFLRSKPTQVKNVS